MIEKLPILLLWMVPFIFSLSFHEFAHGWVAARYGDLTAKMMGRVSMNPIAHMDPIGTVAFPVIGFLTGFPLIGWAKPVPVNERNLKDPANNGMWIAAAGPLSNMFLAVVFTIAAWALHQSGINLYFKLDSTTTLPQAILLMMIFGIQLNVLLAFFNLIPMPPLDGGRVLRGLFPGLSPQLEVIERFGFIILLILLYTGLLKILLMPAFFIIRLLMSWI